MAEIDIQQFEGRKREHIRHSLDPAHQATGLSGLDGIHLYHEALPELDFKEVHLSTICLGRILPTPFYIAGMTAGHADAPQINRTLAIACERRGWAMGVGSQRRELESSQSTLSDEWKKLREELPGLTVFANIGISQLLTTPVSGIRRLVDSVRAHALAVHTNVLQECLQPEGTPDFRGAVEALQQLCLELDVPVILKETGCGFSAPTLERLSKIGLAAIDVSGLGGTHWGRIEGARAREQDSKSIQGLASETFADWGEATSQSVLLAKKILSKAEVWASGGVRTGLDAAKLIALGADRVGYAQPALKAALNGSEELNKWMERQEFELKVALLCTGSATPAALRQKEGSWTISGN